MGRPSQKRLSARRPGKRQRARVKNFRGSISLNVPGAGWLTAKAGQKKYLRISQKLDAIRDALISGEPVKSENFRRLANGQAIS